MNRGRDELTINFSSTLPGSDIATTSIMNGSRSRIPGQYIVRYVEEMKKMQQSFPFGKVEVFCEANIFPRSWISKDMSDKILKRFSKLCNRVERSLPELPHDRYATSAETDC